MTLRKNLNGVTQEAKSVTETAASVTQQALRLARARPLFQGEESTVTRNASVTQSVTHGCDRSGWGQPHHMKQSKSSTTTWMHIAAMNLIADHTAGVVVDPVKLAAAQQLLKGSA